MAATSQTNTWTGGTDTNWGTAANWTLGVPTAAHDVVIPAGSTVVLNVSGNTKSISLNGNANLSIQNSLSFTNPSSFGSATDVNWVSGDLNGGGILNASGTIDITSNNNKFIYGSTTILNNSGTINMIGAGAFFISDGTFNNVSGGLFEFKTGSGSISTTTSGLHSFNNSGTIRLAVAQSNTIAATFTNTGTMTATAGNLILSSGSSTLNGGTYNVSSGANITLNSVVNLTGTLSGVLNGQLVAAATLNVASTATFAFTGTSSVNWLSGDLNGGGTLINNSKMTVESNNNKFIYGTTKLNNNSTIEFIGAGAFYISDGTVNNNLNGLIDSKLNSGSISTTTSGIHRLNNIGTIKKSSLGTFSVNCEIVNTGTFTATAGVLTLSPIQSSKMSGGSYNVSTDAIMNWSADMYFEGTLTGVLSGPLNWNAQVLVDAAAPATFNFSGAAGLIWVSGNLNGGGILTVASPMRIDSNNNKFIYGQSTLTNTSTISQAGGGAFFISDGVVNNLASGIIEYLPGSGGIDTTTSGLHTLNNAGLIRNNDTVNSYLNVYLVNTGTLQSTVGTFNVGSGLGNIFTGGTYNVSNGSIINLTNSITISGTMVGALNGDLNWTGVLLVNSGTSATFNFTGSSSVKWVSGDLNGGGTLINNSPIELVSNNNRFIYGSTTKLNNNSTITHTAAGQFFISDGTFNNNATGIYDSKLNSGSINYTTSGLHVLNNIGTVKKSDGGTFAVLCELHNTGTFSAEAGTLNIQSLSGGTLEGGIYNVSTGAIMNINADITISGTLTGTLNDPLYWTAALFVVSGNPAAFNFTGSSRVNWQSGDLNGGGTLTNMSKLAKTSNNNCYIYGMSTLQNSGLLEVVGAGQLYVSDGFISNLSTGVIDLQSGAISYTTSGTHQLGNEGLIKHTSGGTYYIYPNVTNTGTIDSQSGNLNFASALSLNNAATGRIMGTNTISLPAAGDYTNDGIYAPGGSPGKLTVNGTFKSSSSSVLEVELNSLVPETGYDVLAITGGGNFDGTVNVILGFQPAVGNSFTVATTTGTISSCTLAPTTMSLRNDLKTTFSVACITNNKVVLTVTSIVAVPPITADQAFCAGATVADLVATGQNIKWYANATGGSPLLSTVVLTNAIYYATQTIDGFESTRQSSSVTISTTPMPTAASPQTFSGSATVADLAATGTNIQWYANASGGSALAPASAISTGTYYVSQTLNSCESMRFAVQVIVNPVANMFPFYVDADGDTFGAGNLVNVTAVNATTPPAGYSLNGTDCDDTNAAIYQSASLFVDADGDGYDSGSQTVCYGATIPSGFSQTTSGSDCNDNDATVYRSTSLFVDADGDGYDNGSQTVCYGATVPVGFSQTTLGSDCNDNDATVYQSASLFVDADGDGYDNGSQTVCYGATVPAGFSLTSSGADCNDANAMVNPGMSEIPGNGIDDNCNGQTDETNSGPTVTINPAQCGTTLATLGKLISTTSTPGATAYRFKVVNTTTMAEQTIVRGLPYFTLSMLSSFDYATTYSISVELQLSGVWVGNYGPSCNVSTPNVLATNGATQVNPAQCGITLPTINTLIATTSLQYVTGYRFRVTNLTDATAPNQVQVIDRPLQWFSLPMLSTFTYGTTYKVEVAVKTNGAYSDYGSPCTVTSPAVPSLTNCGGNIASASAFIKTTSLQYGLMYRFLITNLSTNQSATIETVRNYFSFNQVAGYDPMAAYSVQVAVMTSGVYSLYGASCTLNGDMPMTRELIKTLEPIASDLKATAYPNPFVSDFKIAINLTDDQIVKVNIYDMTGRLLEASTMKANEVNETRFASQYPSGVYNCVITSANVTKTLRVIKR